MNEGPARPFIFCGVGWVEPTAKPTMSMPVIHSRKNIETTPPRRWAVSVVLCDGCWSPVCHFRLGRWAVSMIFCEQCVTWTRWVSPLALPTLPPARRRGARPDGTLFFLRFSQHRYHQPHCFLAHFFPIPAININAFQHQLAQVVRRGIRFFVPGSFEFSWRKFRASCRLSYWKLMASFGCAFSV